MSDGSHHLDCSMPLSSGVPKCPKVSQCVPKCPNVFPGREVQSLRFVDGRSCQNPRDHLSLTGLSHHRATSTFPLFQSIITSVGRRAARIAPNQSRFIAFAATMFCSSSCLTLYFTGWPNFSVCSPTEREEYFLRNMCRALFQAAWAGGLRDRERQPELRERRDHSQVPRPSSQSGNLTSDLPEEEKHKLERSRLQRQIQIQRQWQIQWEIPEEEKHNLESGAQPAATWSGVERPSDWDRVLGNPCIRYNGHGSNIWVNVQLYIYALWIWTEQSQRAEERKR